MSSIPIFDLVGHKNPFGRYPNLVIPVGNLSNMGLVALIPDGLTNEVLELEENESYVRHDQFVNDKLETFDYLRYRLFAFAENILKVYPSEDQASFFDELLSDFGFSISNPYLRLALAKKTNNVYSLIRETLLTLFCLNNEVPEKDFITKWYGSHLHSLDKVNKNIVFPSRLGFARKSTSKLVALDLQKYLSELQNNVQSQNLDSAAFKKSIDDSLSLCANRIEPNLYGEIVFLVNSFYQNSSNPKNRIILPKKKSSSIKEVLTVDRVASITEESDKSQVVDIAIDNEQMDNLGRILSHKTRPRACVIMPFGIKEGSDGSRYDFNAVYRQLIKPVLEEAGFDAFRADEATTGGDILTDTFQELLLADLCIADMSIDNANVFYELGLRHAFRKGGIVHIQAGRAYMPFDVVNVRTVPYHITKDGVPDPQFLENDKAAITRFCRIAWESQTERLQSPIYNLFTGLVEPDTKTLRTPLATGFWREYNEWKERLSTAQRQKRIGDILLLTDEIESPLIKEEAIEEAARALANMGYDELALIQYRKGLEVNPLNLNFRREEALHLNNLGRLDEAILKIENLLRDAPNDIETIHYLGSIYSEMWQNCWNFIPERELRLHTAFRSYHWLIKSFETYLKAYQIDYKQLHLGVNAFTLGTIFVHLTDEYDDEQELGLEVDRARRKLDELRGSLFLALESIEQDEQIDYRSLVAIAELRVLTADFVQQVTRAYRRSLTASRRSQSFLQSSLKQLDMLHSLNLRSEFVLAAINVITEENRRIQKEIVLDITLARKGEVEIVKNPKMGSGLVFLFTGYMINNPRKKENNFPRAKEPEIEAAISAMLDKYSAGSNDMAVTTGMSAGSEILFVESCVERGIPVQVYFPLPEDDYVRDFVSVGGKKWAERFYALLNHPLVTKYYQPDSIGLPREGDNVRERNNRWALYSALARGIEKVRLIAFWDGKSQLSRDPDARAVNHMVDLIRGTGGTIEHVGISKSSEINIYPSILTVNPISLPQTNKGKSVQASSTLTDRLRKLKGS